MLKKLKIQKLLVVLTVVLIVDVALNNTIAQVSPLCVTQTPTEAVKNGGFEDGLGAPSTFGPHTLFIPAVPPAPRNFSGSGNYYIGKSPQTFNSFKNFDNSFVDFPPHSGDNMLMIDAKAVLNAVCWQQTVTIIPNRLYFFSAWIRSLAPNERCQLQFQISVNGPIGPWTALGPAQLAPLPDDPWLQVYQSWNSGSNTTATIRLVDINPNFLGGNGNDFAIDDISFKDQCIDPTLGSKPTFPASISLCGKPSIDIPTNVPDQSDIKFTWYKDGVLINNSDVPTLTGVTELGTYTVCVDSNTCLQSNTINVISTLSINLGPDATLCNPATKDLNTGINPANAVALNIKWFKDGVHLPAYDGMVSITVDAPGTYRVDAVDNRPGGCSASDNIVISSTLPIPNHVEFCGPNQTVTLSVTGSGNYRWYAPPTYLVTVKNPDGTTFIGNTLPPIIAPVNGITYYVGDASNPTCQKVAVSAKVAPTCCYALTGTLTPIAGAVCANAPFNLTYSGGQLGDSLMLQKTNDPIAGTWTNVKSVKLSDPFVFNNLSITETTTYRVVTFSKGAWGSAGCQNTSSTTTVNLAVSPIAGTATIDQTVICEGESFIVTLAGYTGTIQWQRSVNGGAFANIGASGVASLTDNPTANQSPVQYRAVVTNGACPSATSNVVVGTIGIAKKGTSLISSVIGAVCAGTNFDITYKNGQLGDSLMLQNRVGTGSWTNVQAVKLSDPYTFTGISITANSDFRVVSYSNGAFAVAPCTDNSSVITVNVVVSPIAGTATIDQTAICESEGFALTLTGSTGTVQWQRSVNGGAFTNIGTTGTSLTDKPTANQSPVKYQAVVTNGTCPSVTSNMVGGDVYIATKGTDLKSETNVCAGSAFNITYSGGQLGDSLMLQSRVGAGAWTNLQAVKLSDPMTFTGISITNTSDFRVVSYSNGAFAVARCTDNSSVITVNVVVSPIAGTATIDQIAICEGSSFTLTLTGYTGTIQWQRSVNGGAFADIIGATSASYTDNPAANLSPVKYQAVVSNGSCPSVTSNVVGGDVYIATKGTDLKSETNVCAGSTFNITYSGGQLGDSLMLQSRVGAGAWTNLQAVKLSDPMTFNGISITNSSDFRVVTYSNGAFVVAQCTDISSVITVNVAISPVAGTATISPAAICKGGSVNLVLTGFTGSIQWQRAYAGASFVDIAGATTANYTDFPTQSPVQYRAVVQGLPCPNVVSNTINATVSEVVAGSITGDSETCDAKSVTLFVNGSKGTIQWQDSSAGTWTNITGQTTSSIIYNPTDTVSTNFIRVLVTDPTGSCAPISSIKFIVVSDTCASIIPIQLANALTPNGDGSNDVFYIRNIDDYPHNHLTIFNRWGSKVYDVYGYKNEWDGNDLPVATYYYVLDLGRDINGNKNSKNTYKGTVTLVR